MCYVTIPTAIVSW